MNDENQKNLTKLAGLVRDLNRLGHNPATSGNYSLRSSENSEIAFISESGIDKSLFTENHFLPININTQAIDTSFSGRKSSDETEVHLAIYQATDANCVLHSHMLEVLLFADIHKGKAFADLKNLELLKGFSGVKTHNINIQIPIFENTQDMTSLAAHMKPSLKIDSNCFGAILESHGIYVWGKSVEETKRHLEVFEYIFKYYINKR